MMKSKLRFVFTVLIAVLTNSNVSIAMSVSSSSYYSGNCSPNRVRCDPNLPQPCCDSNNKCINVDRTKLNAETYICLKEAALGDYCENWFDCEAIIEGKCSEDNTCACNKYSSEWNSTICLYPTLSEKLIPELEKNYNFDEVSKLYFIKADFISQSRLNRVSTIQYGEGCSNDYECSEYGDRGLICADLVQGSSECKCPEWMQFDLKSGSCKDNLELVDFHENPNPDLSDVEILDEKEFSANGKLKLHEFP